MSGLAFFDTNILVYADDAFAPDKQARAIALISEHRRQGSMVISLQVMQEYFAIATRKLGVDSELAQRKVEILARGHVVRFVEQDVIAAIELHRLARIHIGMPPSFMPRARPVRRFCTARISSTAAPWAACASSTPSCPLERLSRSGSLIFGVAEGFEVARGAFRIARHAQRAAVQDDLVREQDPPILGDDLHEVLLDFDRVGVFGEVQAARRCAARGYPPPRRTRCRRRCRAPRWRSYGRRREWSASPRWSAAPCRRIRRSPSAPRPQSTWPCC